MYEYVNEFTFWNYKWICMLWSYEFITMVWITLIFWYISRSGNIKATFLTGYFIATENLKTMILFIFYTYPWSFCIWIRLAIPCAKMGSMINTAIPDLMTGNQYVFLLSKGLPLFNPPPPPSVFYPFILQFFSLRSLGMFCIKRCDGEGGGWNWKYKGVIRESIDKMGWWGTSGALVSFLASVSFMTLYFHGWIFVKFRNFRGKCVCFPFASEP